MTLDTRLLPDRVEWLTLDDDRAVADAIRDMAVRGAPAIGAAAAFGLALAVRRELSDDPSTVTRSAVEAAVRLRAARPTAVNLGWSVERVLRRLQLEREAGADAATLRAAALEEAQRIADEDVEANLRMGALGAALLPEHCTVIHHCNTGALATVDYGTALGVIRAAHEAGKQVRVLVDETRPLLQGARLTAFELGRLGIAHALIVDSAAGSYLRSGEVDAVLVGADRIAANGDTANKIGTYSLAELARANGVPFYVVAPTSTVDLGTPDGDRIPIENRPEHEVTHLGGRRLAPDGTPARNPAFDLTPYPLISAIVTEMGVIRPPLAAGLRSAVAAADRACGGCGAPSTPKTGVTAP